ncbi:hypothetical protein, partial [Kingella kingae]
TPGWPLPTAPRWKT